MQVHDQRKISLTALHICLQDELFGLKLVYFSCRNRSFPCNCMKMANDFSMACMPLQRLIILQPHNMHHYTEKLHNTKIYPISYPYPKYAEPKISQKPQKYSSYYHSVDWKWRQWQPAQAHSIHLLICLRILIFQPFWITTSEVVLDWCR